MKIEFTKHAEDMLKERNLKKELIEEVVFDPDWKEEKEGSYKVITMYYDRRIKDEAQSGYGK